MYPLKMNTYIAIVTPILEKLACQNIWFNSRIS